MPDGSTGNSEVPNAPPPPRPPPATRTGGLQRPRRPRLFLAALAVAFVGTPAGASLYRATTPVAVSGDSPFADCTADENVSYPYPLIIGAEGEPFVAVNPLDSDHIVGSWMQDRPTRGFGVARSFDGGMSWQTTFMPGTSLCSGGDYVRNADPWLDFGADGSLFHIGLPFINQPRVYALAVNSSRDGGLSWSDPIFLDLSYGVLGVDKPSITADPLDPNYVYATWDYRSSGRVAATRFSRSTDGGASWEAPRTTFDVRDDTGFGRDVAHRILVLPDGTLVNLAEHYDAAGWGTMDARLLAQRSADRGVTWAPTDETALVLPFRVVGPTAPDDENGMRVSGLYTAVGRNTGNLYAVWGDDRDEGVCKATFSMSTDAGRTWSEPITVGDTPGGRDLRSQSFLPAVAVAGDGTVGVLYYDWRFDDEEVETLTDVWLAHCHARTADCADRSSWHADARLTESSFDLRELPRPTGPYFPGDYLGLAATEHDFLAFYVQPHDGDPASVFFSRIAPVASSCAGDCDGDEQVRIDELMLGVAIALGNTEAGECRAMDRNSDQRVAVDELVAAVGYALNGCPLTLDRSVAPATESRPGAARVEEAHG